jgi:hypothetical protein
MNLAGLEPAIPTVERPQTHAFTGTGSIISDKANYEDINVYIHNMQLYIHKLSNNTSNVNILGSVFCEFNELQKI